MALLGGYTTAISVGPIPASGFLLLVSLLILVGTAVYSALAPNGGTNVSRNRGIGGGIARKAYPLLLLALSSCFYYSWTDSRNETKLPLAGAYDQVEGYADVTGVILAPVDVDGDRATFYLEASRVDLANYPVYQGSEKLRVTVRLLHQEEQASAASWKRGDLLRLSGELLRPEPARNFGGFDYREYLRRQHVHFLLSVKGVDGIEREEHASSAFSLTTLLRSVDALREKLALAVAAAFPEDQAGYMSGLILGITDGIDPEQYEQFSELGLTHLLAISGLHVAVFVAAFLWLFGLLRIPKETGSLIVMGLLPFYVLLTGAAPSILRAGLMAMLALYAARKNRLKDGLHLVCLAAIAMLLWNPFYALDVGFQLSFLVTAGLILGVPAMSRLLPVKPLMLNGSLSVALVAQLVSFPLTVFYFNQVSLLSLAANLLLVSLVSFIVTPGGTLAMLAALAHPQAAKLLAWPVSAINRVTFGIIAWMNGFPQFRVVWPSPPAWWIPLYYGCGGILLLTAAKAKDAKSRRKLGLDLPERRWIGEKVNGLSLSRVRNVSGVLLVLLLVFGCVPQEERSGAIGTISFLDVGQGDSILIRTPGHRNLLIDGGGTVLFRKSGEEWKERRDPYEVGRKLLVPLLKKRGIGTIDTLIVTHLDDDHFGGLQALLEQLTVHRIVFNGTLKESSSAERFFRTAARKGIPLLQARAGTRFIPDSDTELLFLSPNREADVLAEAAEQNEISLVFQLTMFDSRFLFTGDMGQTTERSLLEGETLPHGSLLGIDVLKVAHHGSKNSTGVSWLSYWHPRYAVISAGKNNRYGHPSEETLKRLQIAQAEVLRTDLQGEIRMKVTRKGLRIESKLGGELK